MPVEKWSDSTCVVHIADDPQFTEDLDALDQPSYKNASTVLDFGAVQYINSSNIAKLLRLHRIKQAEHLRLILCNIGTQVWGTFLITGLDKVFNVSENVPTALATLQMAGPGKSTT